MAGWRGWGGGPKVEAAESYGLTVTEPSAAAREECYINYATQEFYALLQQLELWSRLGSAGSLVKCVKDAGISMLAELLAARIAEFKLKRKQVL